MVQLLSDKRVPVCSTLRIINRDVSSIDLNFFSADLGNFSGRWKPLKWQLKGDRLNEDDRRGRDRETSSRAREQGWLNPSAPRRSSYLPQRDVDPVCRG